MLRKIAGGFALLVLALIALGFVLPDNVHVERQTMIDAPPETVFALVSDFNRWETWSPWADKDAATRYEITGSGVGHKMVWRSDDPNVGNGSQEITTFDPPNSMAARLEFDGNGVATSRFQLAGTPDGATTVVWSFDAKMREGVPIYMMPVGTYMGYFMDGWVGKDYALGLARLKTAAEAAG